MIDLVRKLLSENRDVSAWKINQEKRNSKELFYVQDRLEVSRASDTENTEVTIYCDKDGKRGSTSFTLYPYFDEESLRRKINESVGRALYGLNPYYEIPSPTGEKVPETPSNMSAMSFEEAAEKAVSAVFAASVYRDGYLNATEFFLYRTERRVLNSRGVDVSSVSCSGEIELIPSWEKDDKEVEIYHMIRFSDLHPEELTRQVDEVLLLAKARFEAKDLRELPVPEDVKIIIQDEECSEIFNFFAYDLSYRTAYQHMSRSEIGKSVQGDNITGTKLTLSRVPYCPGAYDSAYVDMDGVVLKPVEIIRDGVAENRFGSYRFGYYLGEKNPTGSLPVTFVKEGTKSFSEMKKEPYIRCVRFSGIQIEPNSGFLGGEVRLGFYFDGTKEIPVTGFSLSGNLFEVRGTMEYSSETVTTSSYHGPKYLEIRGIKAA